MHYEFAPFTFYPERAELTGPKGGIAVEPKALAVLRLLVENHERIVSREEMVEVVWGGRFISDAAVSTALKGARRALGDDGVRQDYIRTLHGLGHRFVAEVRRRVDAAPREVGAAPREVGAEPVNKRPTIAVLPFAQELGDRIQVGDGLADEIISSLSRLRWLRVIARESTFRFRQTSVDFADLRALLGAGYVLTGRVGLKDGRLEGSVTLIETEAGSIVWAERISPSLDDIHTARQEIVAAVIGILDLQIPQAEAVLARHKPTELLDAWGAYHLGMSHLHRWNAHDNAIAAGLLERATRLDPAFAQAFAARAFARFQDALQWFRPDRVAIAAEVRHLAERAVELDPFDPFANMAMGRWHWISGNPDDGAEWYDRATKLSPSHAKSHYSRGFIDAFAGRSDAARQNVDLALGLSPLDPMMGPMLAAKGVSYLVEGQDGLARDWLVRAARNASSHSGIVTGALAASHLAGDTVQAAHWARVLHEIVPDLTVGMYLNSVPLADAAVRARIRAALKAEGLPE